MKDDVVLSVRSVSKKFCRNLKRSMLYGMRDLARNMVGIRPKSCEVDRDSLKTDRAELNYSQPTDSGLRRDEFWALRDISFDLRRGECLGLIGQNGSGKSTLLRLLDGIFPPDAGMICIHGRTGALISLGAGFHPHMTGRENIYLNAAILGLARDEINQRFNDIVDFAEIGPFIDAPVATYSSGMYVKLGFAIAIHVKPDLLLIDEVLAVGDMGFIIKCVNAMRCLMTDTAVVFVSHSMQFVSQFCNRIAVMEHGRFTCDTRSVETGIDHYLSLFPTEKTEAGSGGVKIENIQLHARGQTWSEHEEIVIRQGEELMLSFDIKITDSSCKNIRIAVNIMDQGLEPVISLRSSDAEHEVYAVNTGCYHVRAPLGVIDLNGGKYSFVFVIMDGESRLVLSRTQGVGKFRVSTDRFYWARVVRDANFMLERT